MRMKPSSTVTRHPGSTVTVHPPPVKMAGPWRPSARAMSSNGTDRHVPNQARVVASGREGEADAHGTSGGWASTLTRTSRASTG